MHKQLRARIGDVGALRGSTKVRGFGGKKSPMELKILELINLSFRCHVRRGDHRIPAFPVPPLRGL